MMKSFNLPPVVITPIGRIAAVILELIKGSDYGDLQPQVVLCRVDSGKRRMLPRRCR
jgi:hypothetical protein